jgi:hypothetical protein
MRVVYNTETVKGYMAEQQCLALVRVANAHNTPLSNIRVEYWLQYQKYGEIPLSSLAVDGMEDISLPFVPKDAGQYSLSLRIFCHTEQGDIVELSSALINFQVHHQGAPSNVHIHQTGERVFGNHNKETFWVGAVGRSCRLNLWPCIRQGLHKSRWNPWRT